MSEPGFTHHCENEDLQCALGHVLKKATMVISPFQRVRMSCCYPQEIKRAKLSLSFMDFPQKLVSDMTLTYTQLSHT